MPAKGVLNSRDASVGSNTVYATMYPSASNAPERAGAQESSIL